MQPPRTHDELRQHQLQQLCSLLQAVRSNPFQQHRLQQARFDTELPSTLDAYSQRMPLTTKADLVADQLAHPPFGSNLTFPLEQYTRLHQTSGTTSSPIRWLDTPEGWQWMLDNWKHVYRSAGVASADRVYFAFSFGPFLGFWTAFESAQQIGCLCIPGGGLSSAARLRQILDTQATVLCCTPTYALRLADTAREEGIDLSRAKVRCVIVAGEPGGNIPATRDRIQAGWNQARVIDHHGMTEVGPVSYPCPALPHLLHVIESSYLAEVLVPGSTQHATANEVGELVLTTLGRAGSPLLRYRTGDLVHPLPERPCACGSLDLALQGGILGRADDMVIVRSVNVYPSAVEQVVQGFAGVQDYRVNVENRRGMTELSVTIEPRASCSDPAGLAEQVAAALHRALLLRMEVQVAQPGQLPRSEFKSARWNRVAQGR